MIWYIRNDHHLFDKKRDRRLMRLMGLMPTYQKPNTGKAAKGQEIYFHLLRSLRVSRLNQVWRANIIYLPMRPGFLYLVALMDWHTRKVLAVAYLKHIGNRVCVDALNAAFHKFDLPKIMNTEQCSQFTSYV